MNIAKYESFTDKKLLNFGSYLLSTPTIVLSKFSLPCIDLDSGSIDLEPWCTVAVIIVGGTRLCLGSVDCKF